jgi:coproporphyrinogen III oxidase-like Fe-S oxidoreductase
VRNPERYLKLAGGERAATSTFVEELGPIDLVRERVLTGLRLLDGIDLGSEPFASHPLATEQAVGQGLARKVGSRLVPTARGRLHADTLAELVAP